MSPWPVLSESSGTRRIASPYRSLIGRIDIIDTVCLTDSTGNQVISVKTRRWAGLNRSIRSCWGSGKTVSGEQSSQRTLTSFRGQPPGVDQSAVAVFAGMISDDLAGMLI